MTEQEIGLAQIIWDYHHISDQLKKSNLILGLGSYDTRVANHCAGLLADDWAPLCVFSGAEGNFTRGKWNRSEAQMFADVAIEECGANPDQIRSFWNQRQPIPAITSNSQRSSVKAKASR